MSVAELKRAICQLRPEERTELAAFLMREDNADWDQQIDRDAAAGKLDRLFDEADDERSGEGLQDWPGR